MPKTDWQALDKKIAEDVMGCVKWDELTDEEQDAVKQWRVWRHYDGYWWQRGEGTPRLMCGTLLWQPHKNAEQAVLVLRTLLTKIGRHVTAKLDMRPPPGRCQVTIQNWVWTGKVPAMFVKGPETDNERHAICLAIEKWLDAQKEKQDDPG